MMMLTLPCSVQAKLLIAEAVRPSVCGRTHQALSGQAMPEQRSQAQLVACAGGPMQAQQPGPTRCCQGVRLAQAPALRELGRWWGCQAQGWRKSLPGLHLRQQTGWLHLRRPHPLPQPGRPCQPSSSSSPSCAACAAHWHPAHASRAQATLPSEAWQRSAAQPQLLQAAMWVTGQKGRVRARAGHLPAATRLPPESNQQSRQQGPNRTAHDTRREASH